MSILTATNLGHAFGALDVFSNISVSIPNDAKIGLVGPNGVGKTTLLRILAGVSQPDTGSVQWARGSRMGYLRQEAVQAFAGREHSVYEEMLTVFSDLRAQQARLQEMEATMALSHAPALVAEYGAAQEQFELAGGYEYEIRIRQVLDGLGFQAEQWETPLTHLSGGQKTRALLARLLLERPTLLILDEPTNHLDVEAIEWLEGTLRLWEGALLVVSHDRYFLDKVVNRIWEMSASHLEVYRGNYSAYLQQRQERWERHEQLYEAERERLGKELEFIRRHIAGQNTDIAAGKLKRLTRDLLAIEEVGIVGMQGKSWSELELGRVRSLSVSEADLRIKSLRGPTRPPRLRMQLKGGPRSGTIVLSTQALVVGYPGTPLFRTDDLELEREACAALIGPNGTGKTTFLRTVLGQHPPLAGEAKLGTNLKIGYFAQAHDGLNPDKSVLDELMAHKIMPIGDARDYLAQYLFRGDDVYRPVRALSGGERGRLALAILALQGANLLLLDEPTNHLDIPAQEVLQEGLERFPGTILLVSHDRYLVARLATEIWELRDGVLHSFKGDYQAYLEAREREREAAREEAVSAKSVAPTPTLDAPKISKNEARRQAEALARIEARIMELEATLEQQSSALQSASEVQDLPAIQRLSEQYATTQAQLEGLWAELEESELGR